MRQIASYTNLSRINRQQLELERAVLRLAHMHESIRIRQEALINESLSTHKMSSFLFEAEDIDVTSAASSLDTAIEAADKMLKITEEAADKLDSDAIKKVTSELRDKLQKVALEGRLEPDAVKNLQKSDGEKKSKIVGLTRDASNFILDKLGYTTKQLTFITQSLANVNKTIFATASAVSKMLKLSKINLEKAKGSTLKNIFLQGQVDDLAKEKIGYKDEASFKEAIVKVIKGSFGDAKGLLARIKGFLQGAGADPINLDPNAFADDILKTPLGKIIEWTNSEAAKIAKKPEAATKTVTNPIGKATTAAGTDQKSVGTAAKSLGNESPPKTPADASNSERPTKGAKDKEASRKAKFTWPEEARVDGLSPDQVEKITNYVNKKADETILERRRIRRSNDAILLERWAKLAGIKDVH